MSHNTLIHRVVRPVVRVVAPSGVSPNQLTSLRLLTGAAAGGCCASGRAGWIAAGGALLLASLLLDRADGELARQTGRTSLGGYRYDLICDCLATVLAFLGMGVGARAVLGPAGPWLGALAGVSVVVVFLEINVVRLGPPPRAGRLAAALFDPDDAMLFTPVLIWAGLMPWVVVGAATLTPLVAVALAVLGGREALRQRRSRRAASTGARRQPARPG